MSEKKSWRELPPHCTEQDLRICRSDSVQVREIGKVREFDWSGKFRGGKTFGVKFAL